MDLAHCGLGPSQSLLRLEQSLHVTMSVLFAPRWALCNGHYNRTPDLGKCVMWWDVWDLARHTILDAKVLDRNVTWLSKHKDTS